MPTGRMGTTIDPAGAQRAVDETGAAHVRTAAHGRSEAAGRPPSGGKRRRRIGGRSSQASNCTLPPAAVVFTVRVCSAQKRIR